MLDGPLGWALSPLGWLYGAVAGARVKAIFKEPTVTPTEVQKKALGLNKAWGSPNGAMRRGCYFFGNCSLI